MLYEQEEYVPKKVEVHRRIGFLPIEQKIIQKKYKVGAPGFIEKFHVSYDFSTSKLILSGTDSIMYSSYQDWADTIIIKNARKHNTQ